MAQWRGTVRRVWTVEEFRQYVENDLKFTEWRPSFVVVHNTSVPSKKKYTEDWLRRKDWSPLQWCDNLAAYYSGMGWKAGPHLFVLPTGHVLGLSPMTGPGTHAPSWNSRSIGIETVGEYETEVFDDVTHDTLVAVLAILHEKLGLVPEDYLLGVRGLHFHKEDPKTTHKSCPGKNIVKSRLVADVVAAMQSSNPGGHVHVPETVATAPVPAEPIVEATNTSITWVQKSLNRWRPSLRLEVDGLIPRDGKTYEAVKLFQNYFRLKVDGIPGPRTRAAMRTFT